MNLKHVITLNKGTRGVYTRIESMFILLKCLFRLSIHVQNEIYKLFTEKKVVQLFVCIGNVYMLIGIVAINDVLGRARHHRVFHNVGSGGIIHNDDLGELDIVLLGRLI